MARPRMKATKGTIIEHIEVIQNLSKEIENNFREEEYNSLLKNLEAIQGVAARLKPLIIDYPDPEE